MKGRSINNLQTICINQSTDLKYEVNKKCLLSFSCTQLSETLLWEYYQQGSAFYKIDNA